jgi:hypothetical protein
MFGPTVGLKRAVKIGGIGVMLLKMVGLVTPDVEKEAEEEMKKEKERKEAEIETPSDDAKAESADIILHVDDVDEGPTVRFIVQKCVVEAFDTIERSIATKEGSFSVGKHQESWTSLQQSISPSSSNLHLWCSSLRTTFDSRWVPTAEVGTHA